MIVIPTRHRRANIERFIECYRKTKACVRVLIVIDDDDDSYIGVDWPETFIVHHTPRMRFTSEYINMLPRMYPHEPWYMALGDDMAPRTDYWDARLAYWAERGFFVDFSDGITESRSDVIGHCAIPGFIVRALGWQYCPHVRHFYADNVYADFAQATGMLHFCGDVYIEHMHFSNGKADRDAIYAQRGSSPEDRGRYHSYLCDQFCEDVGKIIAAYADNGIPLESCYIEKHREASK